jgi:hypothetical protein
LRIAKVETVITNKSTTNMHECTLANPMLHLVNYTTIHLNTIFVYFSNQSWKLLYKISELLLQWHYLKTIFCGFKDNISIEWSLIDFPYKKMEIFGHNLMSNCQRKYNIYVNYITQSMPTLSLKNADCLNPN